MKIEVALPRPIVLIGSGEHAAMIAEAIRLSEPDRPIAGVLDTRAAAAERLGLPWLGDDEAGLPLARAASHDFVLALGAVQRPYRRGELAARYESAGARFATVVHPRAIVAAGVRRGAGSVVLAGAIINRGARLGAHTVINTGAIVEHDVEIGDHTLVGPGAVIGGGTWVGPEGLLGLGCRVRDHVRLGRSVLVGMGAVVVRDASDGQTLLGVPARPREEPA